MNDQKPIPGRKLALIGAWLQLGPVIGAAGAALGMMRAIGTLAEAPGVSDPQRFSADIGEVLIATAAGLVLSVVGLVLVCIALFGYRYRAEWFFWFLVIYGALLLLGFPVGSVVGLVFLVFCLTRRHEFLNRHEGGA
jgi:hypothetical protein